jgi:cation diffusion facilitator family transporter
MQLQLWRARGRDPHHDHGADHDHEGHDHLGPTDPATLATRDGIRATWLSLGLLALTALAQFVVVMLSGSVALLADTLHNVTDALTAIPLLIAFSLSRRPASRRYPYGYHRAEDLAGIAILSMIAASAILTGWEAIRRLLDPRPIDDLGLVLAAGAIGFLGNEAVALYRMRVGRRIGSAALVADGYHARADGLTSLGVIVSALGVWLGFDRADAAVGLAITGAIVLTLVRAGRSVLHRALDGADEETIDRIEALALAVPGVEHATDVKARWSGHRLLAELCIDVDPALTVVQGHELADQVRDELREHVPRLVEATVHVDPHDH